MQYEIVKDPTLLRAMRRAGIVKFTEHTLKKIKALYSSDTHQCFYIDEAPTIFDWQGKTYGQKFFSGCFYPYLVEYKNP